MKAAVAANGIDGDSSSDDEGTHSIEAGPLAGKSHKEDDEEDSMSTKDKVVHTGKKKFASAFRKVAKKAATFRADVHVEGDNTRQKVRLSPSTLCSCAHRVTDQSATSLSSRLATRSIACSTSRGQRMISLLIVRSP